MDIPLPIGVSTAWNAHRHSSGRAMIQELLDLGFSHFELSVHVTAGMMAEISDLVREGRASICSLHNYCPVPPAIDRETAAVNTLYLSSPSQSTRRRAVAETKNTIDWANRLGARIVVLHLGNVPLKQNCGNIIFELVSQGRREEAKELLTSQLMERAVERSPHIENLIDSLKELAPYAADAGIKLGCENRYFYTEIPSLDEFRLLFKHVGSRALGYWHDSGHAHVNELLGIGGQEDYLKRYHDRLVGMHIHDATGHNDHKALGTGDIELARFTPFVKRDTQLVLEIHRSASPDELVRSRKILIEARDKAEATDFKHKPLPRL